MPSFRHHDHGNMYVQFDVKFPEPHFTEDPKAFEALRTILPSLPQANAPTGDVMTEVADLEEIDASQQARAAGATGMDDMDDDEHPGGERVQCASQ